MFEKCDKEKAKPERCRSMKGDGVRCSQYTRDSSGLCNAHRNGQDFFSEGFLKCDNCVVTTCEFKGKGVKGFCYYEITDKVSDLDTKINVVEGMRRTIALEMRLVTRIERAINLMKVDNEEYISTVHLLAQINDQLNRHLQSYGRFLGWQSESSTASQKEERLKILEKIFKDDPKDKFLEETVPSVQLEDEPEQEEESDAPKSDDQT